ncbi:MAG: shikimate dehydrogenase, partial [Pseudomonadota bacterium]
LTGDNTDGFGFLESLKHGAPDWRADQGPAVVLGAGGASRAVISALLGAGCQDLRLTNRTRERAEDLASHFGESVTVLDWDERSACLADAGLLVNTTSLGMTGQPPLDLSLDLLPTDAVVTDNVYSPLETPLLAAAVQRGNSVVDGMGMLLHQARPGFAAWFGVEPVVDEFLRAAVLASR